MFAASSEFCFESCGEFAVIPVDVYFSESKDANVPVVHAVYRTFPFCYAISSGNAIYVLVEHSECVLVGVCPDCVPVGYIFAGILLVEACFVSASGRLFPGVVGSVLV